MFKWLKCIIGCDGCIDADEYLGLYMGDEVLGFAPVDPRIAIFLDLDHKRPFELSTEGFSRRYEELEEAKYAGERFVDSVIAFYGAETVDQVNDVIDLSRPKDEEPEDEEPEDDDPRLPEFLDEEEDEIVPRIEVHVCVEFIPDEDEEETTNKCKCAQDDWLWRQRIDLADVPSGEKFVADPLPENVVWSDPEPLSWSDPKGYGWDVPKAKRWSFWRWLRTGQG